MTPAVVLGLSPTGLYAIRELGRAGVPVLGAGAEAQTAAHSRYLNWGPRRLIEPEEARRLERLMALVAEGGEAPVLIPTSDQDVAFVVRHAERLSERFIVQPSYRDGVHARLFGKAQFHAACREHGLETPACWQAPRAELAGLRRAIAYPCLMKPSEIHAVKDEMAGRKVLIARHAEAFDEIVRDLPTADIVWLVQEIVPGPESAITLYCAYFDGEGAPRQAFTARKLRQYPPGFGSASLVRSADLPETRALSERLLGGVGYRGIAAAEFKRDPRDGRLKAIEVNVRPSLWFAAAAAAGKHVTLAAWRDLTGWPLPEEQAQLDGVEWRYLLKDLYAQALWRRARGFTLPPPDLEGLPRPARRVTPVLDLADLRPSLDELLTYAGKFRQRLSR